MSSVNNQIFDLKVDPHNLESQNQAQNIPAVHPSSPIKVEANIGVPELWSDKQIDRQTDKQRLQLYIYIEDYIPLTIYIGKNSRKKFCNYFQV